MRRKSGKCGHCGCGFAIATPEEICAYLERHDWVRMDDALTNNTSGSTAAWAVFRLSGAIEIEVPLMRKASDWDLRYRQCLENIWRIEVSRGHTGRTIADIAYDMLPAQERIERAEGEMLRHGSLAVALTAEAKS